MLRINTNPDDPKSIKFKLNLYIVSQLRYILFLIVYPIILVIGIHYLLLLEQIYWKQYEAVIIGLWMLVAIPMIIIYLWAIRDLFYAYYLEYKHCNIWWDSITDYDVCEYLCNNHTITINDSIRIPESTIDIIYEYYTEIPRKSSKLTKIELDIVESNSKPYKLIESISDD